LLSISRGNFWLRAVTSSTNFANANNNGNANNNNASNVLFVRPILHYMSEFTELKFSIEYKEKVTFYHLFDSK
jgi:hypothetical protein